MCALLRERRRRCRRRRNQIPIVMPPSDAAAAAVLAASKYRDNPRPARQRTRAEGCITLTFDLALRNPRGIAVSLHRRRRGSPSTPFANPRNPSRQLRTAVDVCLTREAFNAHQPTSPPLSANRKYNDVCVCTYVVWCRHFGFSRRLAVQRSESNDFGTVFEPLVFR